MEYCNNSICPDTLSIKGASYLVLILCNLSYFCLINPDLELILYLLRTGLAEDIPKA